MKELTNTERYERAVHCVQAGSKMIAAKNGEHPQSRTGINISMRDHSSIVQLLVEKGVITEEEYIRALADGMEHEVHAIEDELSSRDGGAPGVKVTLVGRYGGVPRPTDS